MDQDAIHRVKWWQDPRYFVRAAWCSRCQAPHDPDLHFDRCAFDRAAIAELSHLEIASRIVHDAVDGPGREKSSGP